MIYALRTEVLARPVLADTRSLVEYLFLNQAHAPAERFRVLYLNAKNRLLAETVADGSISDAPVYPREIMRKALEVGATALILVHNHPSGDPQPSRSDIEVTRNIIEAGRQLEVRVHDHLVVARGGTISFRALGLL